MIDVKKELKKSFENVGFSKEVICGLLGNIKIECNFETRAENMTYTTAQGLRNTFSVFRKMSDSEIEKYVVKKELKPEEKETRRKKIGDLAYSKLGGYQYRGRGFIQLTGIENYRSYGKAIGIDLVNNPIMALELKTATLIAIEYVKRECFGRVPELNKNKDIEYVADVITKCIQGWGKDYKTPFLKKHLEEKRLASIKFYENYENI